MVIGPDPLKIYEAGELTVIGFGTQPILDNINIAEFREQVTDIVHENDCKTLAFDLTGVKLIPSGLLGLLASLRDLGVEIHLYNPSDDVREVLSITKLDQVMTVHDIDVGQKPG